MIKNRLRIMQNARKPLPIQSMSNMPIAIQNKIKPSIRFTGYLHFERILTRKGFFFEKNRVYYRICYYAVNLNIFLESSKDDRIR